MPTKEFVFVNEDHTLGCILQEILLKNDEVISAGYIKPNPHEKKIILKIETKKIDPRNILDLEIKKLIKELPKLILL
jgi:DNA-directed RNA polymerase subunit L